MENENKDKREQIEGATLKILSIEAQLGSFGEEEGKIKKLIINAIKDDGSEIRITHKPKETAKDFLGGILVTKQIMTDTPPKFISKVGEELQKKGFCMVRGFYTVWEQHSKELNKLKPAVRYVQWGSTLDKWEIIKDFKEDTNKD